MSGGRGAAGAGGGVVAAGGPEAAAAPAAAPAAGAAAAEVLRLLGERGETLAVAESLTGGLVAAEVTAVPGASQVFRGSVTAYATELKQQVLGVDGALLAARGAVDADVALQMAAGVRGLLGADWGLATTGVAGPDPQDGKSVGTVFVAVVGPGSPLRSEGNVAALRLNGNRTEIRTESVRSVLGLLLRQLSGERAGNGRAQDTEQNGGT
ncbi:CinA family protein [Streptomyces lasiicapitis]|uniref:Competence damage-inducible protein A n=1 Tax=Streptomyces lasiicapitis TaxID=1923961 RepID=A0ABQ2LK53_9ACTN|nr:nicotinamide-nucleotide amidohydrolase family protein [Streptomyces lasiicapitis]GGO37914.1 competence damage-inducible protein A [Streptomyces lasiicapitis]